MYKSTSKTNAACAHFFCVSSVKTVDDIMQFELYLARAVCSMSESMQMMKELKKKAKDNQQFGMRAESIEHLKRQKLKLIEARNCPNSLSQLSQLSQYIKLRSFHLLFFSFYLLFLNQ